MEAFLYLTFLSCTLNTNECGLHSYRLQDDISMNECVEYGLEWASMLAEAADADVLYVWCGDSIDA